MQKVEKLIKGLSGMPGDLSTADIVQVEKSSLMSDISLQHMKNETTLSDIHRIAREISMLKLSVNDAKVLRAKNDFFIENLERQIQSATSLFKVCLEHCFVNSLKHQDASFIDKCLCAYGYIDNTLAAEEIFRKTIVAPLVQNILCGDISLEELEEYYRQIKHCIENDWNFFLKLSLSGLHVSDFWANSILKEVILAIKNGKPKAFSPDELMVFLNNYNSSLRFLAFLEGYFPSLSDVDMLRSDIMRQLNVWNYFSHRLQEIARSLDSVLGDYANTLSDKKVRTKFGSRHSKFMLSRMVVRRKDYYSCSNSTADGINDFIFIEGTETPEKMLTILQRVVEECTTSLVAARLDAEERRNNIRLREEQDAAYRSALEAGQARERQRKEEHERLEREAAEAERKRKEEAAALERAAQEAAEKQAVLVRRRQEKAMALGEEPEKGPDVTQVLVRFPNGERKERRFHCSAIVESLYTYVDSLDCLSAEKYSLISNSPRVSYGHEKHSMSLKQAGLHSQASLFVEIE